MVSELAPSIVTMFALESVFFIIKQAPLLTAVGSVIVTAPLVAFTSCTLMPSTAVSDALAELVLYENAKLLASRIWSKFVIYDRLILKALLPLLL